MDGFPPIPGRCRSCRESFHSNFYLYEDLDYGWRANLAGFKSVYVPESIVYHKFGVAMKKGTFLVRYFTEKNRIQTLLKNYKLGTLIKIFPYFIAERIKKSIYNSGTKKMRFSCYVSFLLAWGWNILNIHKTLRKRSKVQAMRHISDNNIMDLMGDYRRKVFTI